MVSRYNGRSSPDITSPAGDIPVPKEDFLVDTATICSVSCCIICLLNRKKKEGESGLQRAAGVPPLCHPTGTGAATQPGQRCVAVPVSPATISAWWHPGADRPGRWREEAVRKELALSGTGGSHTARASWAAAGQAGKQRPFPCHISSRVQRSSPSYTTSEQHPIPSSGLFSCLIIFLCTPNLAKGTCWNGAMLLVL